MELGRFLSPTRAVLVHIGVLAVTCFALPIGLPSSLPEPPAGDAYFWLLSVLALGVGQRTGWARPSGLGAQLERPLAVIGGAGVAQGEAQRPNT